MEFLGIYLLLLLLVVSIAVCVKLNICDSRMRMLNADWLEESEKYKLISRWGVRL